MKHSRRTPLFGALAFSASLLTIGCNSEPQVTDPNSTDGNTVKPVTESPQYTDISSEEAKLAKPLTLVGVGPMAHADTAMLTALKKSYLEQGTPLLASQLELSYDFTTGQFKGDPKLLSPKSTGLEKSASAPVWDYNFGYQGWLYNPTSHESSWTFPVGNDKWIGSPGAGYGLSPLLQGWHISTTVVNGTTPSLYWKMYWKDYGWSSWYGWNSQGLSTQFLWQGFSAYSSYSEYNICYAMDFAGSNGTARRTGCNLNSIQPITGMSAVAMKITIIRKAGT